MPQVSFTSTLERHLAAPASTVPGATVREALEEVFRANPRLRSYVVDEQGRLRKHVAVFVDGEVILDRLRLSDPVQPTSAVFVMQALSGG
ncbi:MAG TPA: MoaD/ThiS family protein [Anaeromyxobacter sp.]|nr:MoaD/ThiS family protein [Anaeromyxobacter sp.]